MVDQIRDELVRRASIANHGNIFVSEVERMIPTSAVEHTTPKLINIQDVFRAVGYIAEANSRD